MQNLLAGAVWGGLGSKVSDRLAGLERVQGLCFSENEKQLLRALWHNCYAMGRGHLCNTINWKALMRILCLQIWQMLSWTKRGKCLEWGGTCHLQAAHEDHRKFGTPFDQCIILEKEMREYFILIEKVLTVPSWVSGNYSYMYKVPQFNWF